MDPQSFEAQYKELEHVTESLLQYLDPVQDVSMKRIRDETEQLLRSGHSVPAALLHWGNRMRALSGLQFAPEEVWAGQSVFRKVKTQGGGDPLPLPLPLPPQTNVTIVGKKENYSRENLVGPFWYTHFWAQIPIPPCPPCAQKTP